MAMRIPYRMTATEAAKRFAAASRKTGDAPVEITSHGHTIAYMISAEEYRRLTEKEGRQTND